MLASILVEDMGWEDVKELAIFSGTVFNSIRECSGSVTDDFFLVLGLFLLLSLWKKRCFNCDMGFGSLDLKISLLTLGWGYASL